MRKLRDLTAEDFPGMDPVKFEQWKEATLQMQKNWSVALIVLVIINVVLFTLTGSLVLGGLAFLGIMFFVNLGPARVARQLEKELGITRAGVRAARKRAPAQEHVGLFGGGIE